MEPHRLRSEPPSVTEPAAAPLLLEAPSEVPITPGDPVPAAVLATAAPATAAPSVGRLVAAPPGAGGPSSWWAALPLRIRWRPRTAARAGTTALVGRVGAAFLRLIVITLLVTATWAWIGLHKTVTIRVDGRPTTVSTYASTVGGALAAAHLSLGPHDVVLPAPSRPLRNHEVIQLLRGRKVRLVVDGAARAFWTTQSSVRAVLVTTGLGLAGAVVRPPPTTPVGLQGLTIDVLLAHHLTIAVAGRAIRLTTTATTVGAALTQVGVRLTRLDRVSVPLGAYPTDGMIVTVTFVRLGRLVTTSLIPFPTEDVGDPSLYVGQSRVAQPGSYGVLTSVYSLTYVNGRLARQLLVSRRETARPSPRVIDVGTTPPPPQESCLASWYNQYGYGAANLTLPFGTRVRVVNVDTGASVTVTINDRGPYVTGRCIDLDVNAFAAIAPLGEGVVPVELYW